MEYFVAKVPLKSYGPGQIVGDGVDSGVRSDVIGGLAVT